MTRVVILGGYGMLGTELRAAFAEDDVVAPRHLEVDLRDPVALHAVIESADVVINAAAYTRVDEAESNFDTAFAVNAVGAGQAARAAQDAGAAFVQISTDYVFDGSANEPYSEDAELHPLSVYGRSKAEGERLVAVNHEAPFIVRTAWLYGAGPSFGRTIMRLAAQPGPLRVVTGQIGQPSWAVDVAAAVYRLVAAGTTPGIYHATNAGHASRVDYARAVLESAGEDPDRVLPVDDDEWAAPAPRPQYSVLSHNAWTRAGIPAPRDWREAIAAAGTARVWGPE
jgi:dTDP-4-dehydrorhamnose reductase